MGSTPLRQQLSLMRQSFFDEVFFFFFFILGVGQLLPPIILGDGKGNEAFSLRKNFEVIYGLLDHGQVSYLETLENEDDPDFIEDVFSLFLRDSSRYIAAIDKALETTPDDYPFILERMMYRLKGSSASAKASLKKLKEGHAAFKQKLAVYVGEKKKDCIRRLFQPDGIDAAGLQLNSID
ncbi:unnamed protein product [Dovyalis caffra]|uniref:Histidine-containing phosphotransfer protein n=1 Tax=Dovyalis caffra TaxID=77055 RepID=A0AAV1S4M9_9ROSI|nr:unnamed protein product [Dovyalis caffra]